jgi:hypothetical protein
VNRVANVAEPDAADPVLRTLRPLMPAGVKRSEAMIRDEWAERPRSPGGRSALSRQHACALDPGQRWLAVQHVLDQGGQLVAVRAGRARRAPAGAVDRPGPWFDGPQ